MEKKTNKSKLEILNFWENQPICKVIAFDKISQNCAFYGNSININLLGFFACRIHICEQNSAKSCGFHEKANIIENHWFLLIVWDFHWNSWADCHKKSKNIIFRWKRRQIKQN